MARRFRIRRPIKAPRPNPDAAKALGMVIAITETQVGGDDSPSPMLDALVDEIGLDPDGVELAQDAALLMVDVGKAIQDAVLRGDVSTLPFVMLGLVGKHVPELARDIDALKR